MTTISRSITELAADERSVMERFVGERFTDNQWIIVQVLDGGGSDTQGRPRTAMDYAILSDLDKAEANLLTEAMTKRSPGREIDF